MGPDYDQNIFSHHLPSPPFLSSLDYPQPDIEFKENLLGVPKPMESLYETPVPPFLSKTYDLVDEPSLDYIISWGEKGRSFVVWQPVEFARTILPRNFKHNNFSSFVRQLNTYGFRKIDTDKWEFMNEGFVRGQRHLLRKIQRRKSHQSQQFDALSSPSNKSGKDALEGEIEGLRKERSSIMQEVVALQHEQLGTIQHIEVVKEKLEAAESRQRQMVSFLAKILQDPKFSGGLQKPSDKTSIAAPRPVRKFVKHSSYNSSPEGQTCLLQNSPNFGEEQIPSQIGDVEGDETAMVQELLSTPEDESVPIFRTVNPILDGQEEMNSQLQSVNDYYISSGEDLWSMGFGGGDGMCSFSNEHWGDLSNYHEQEQSGLSDIWDDGSVKLDGSSGIGRWLDQESPF